MVVIKRSCAQSTFSLAGWLVKVHTRERLPITIRGLTLAERRANVWDVGPALSQRWANTCGGGVARPDPIHWELVWKGFFFNELQQHITFRQTIGACSSIPQDSIYRPLGYERVYLPLGKWQIHPFISKGTILYYDHRGVIDLTRSKTNRTNFISSPWIWKGVSATFPSGRYTLSYLRGRYKIGPVCFTSSEIDNSSMVII